MLALPLRLSSTIAALQKLTAPRRLIDHSLFHSSISDSSTDAWLRTAALLTSTKSAEIMASAQKYAGTFRQRRHCGGMLPSHGIHCCTQTLKAAAFHD